MLVNKKELHDAVVMAATVINRHSSIAILQKVKLSCDGNHLHVIGTGINSQTYDYVYTQIDGSGEPFDVVVDPKSLRGICRGNIQAELKVTDGKLRVGDASIMAESAQDYAMEPKTATSREPRTWNAQAFKAGLKYCIQATSNDPTRFHMNGILLDPSGQLVAVDGYRMHIASGLPKWPKLKNYDVILSGSIIPTIIRAITSKTELVTIIVNMPYTTIRVGQTTVITKLIEAQFVPWRQVVPNDMTIKADVQIDDFTSTVNDALPLCSETRGIKLTIDDAKVSIEADNFEGQFARTIPARTNGGSICTGFNPRYLLEALNGTKDKAISLELNGEFDPMRIAVRGDGLSLMAVIMPMRL